MSSNWNNFSGGPDDDGPQAINEELPACGSCRRRKLKCSRDHPVCSHCRRLVIPCVYEPKQKPGLKAGAVESLTRRVAFLEQIILDNGGQVRPHLDPGNEIGSRRREESPVSKQDPPTHSESLLAESIPSENTVSEAAADTDPPRYTDHYTNPRKRKPEQRSLTDSLLDMTLDEIFDYLPPQPLLLKLVDYFCVTFHHWIPYLHKQRLRTSVCNLSRDPQLALVLHALVATTLKHLDRNISFMDADQIWHQTRVSRFVAETFALKNVSLESLRALIIIVFDYLNGGQYRKAWPLIGSLTRTVDYLQLTVEPSATQFGALMRPLKLVQPTDDFTELEERRRLFWVVFLLDRFCSVSTGWNTSLTSEDVHRRLPADGGYFTREEIVTTPYFGIWNKSSAKIGKSLAHVPAQYNEDDPVVDQVQGTSPGSANSHIDSSKLGAFAYCIEATESLSQVTTFFLQQRINWQDKEHAVNWLTRFKELDLRLVHWKLFLPPRWKDSNISQKSEVVDMDPNLTLAHITHNTSMILLHHPIAYPPRGWNNYVALPKECSAQTCELAAVETSNIVDKFLTHRDVFVNVQFAFCAFVAAKVLLYEYQATRKPIRPEFQMLTRSLWEMSARWRSMPPSGEESDPPNQAGIFARHLEYLQDTCHRDPRFRFDLYDHLCQERDCQNLMSPTQTMTPASQASATPLMQEHRPPPSNPNPNPARRSGKMDPLPSPSMIAPNAPHLANILYSNNTAQPPSSYPPQKQQHQQHSPTAIPPSSYMGPLPPGPPDRRTASFDVQRPNVYTPTLQDESLLSLADAFMDSQFLDLDRVITFEDRNFFLPGDGY